MKRIDSATAEADLFGAGKDGFVAGAAPLTSATHLNPSWCNNVQEEIANVVERTDQTLSGTVYDQLSLALHRLAVSQSLGSWVTHKGGPKSYELYGVAVDPATGTIVAVGEDDTADAYIVSATHDDTFGERSNAKNIALNDVVWSVTDSVFVAVGNADGTDAYILTSPDSITWTERANPKNYNLETIVEYNGTYVAAGASDTSDTYIVTSTDAGVTWTERTAPGNTACYSSAYGGGVWVLAASVTSNLVQIYRSIDDGVTWAFAASVQAPNVYPPGNGSRPVVAYNGTRFSLLYSDVAAGREPLCALSSDDGDTWAGLVEYDHNGDRVVTDLWGGDGIFIALAEYGMSISTDGGLTYNLVCTNINTSTSVPYNYSRGQALTYDDRRFIMACQTEGGEARLYITTPIAYDLT